MNQMMYQESKNKIDLKHMLIINDLKVITVFILQSFNKYMK